MAENRKSRNSASNKQIPQIPQSTHTPPPPARSADTASTLDVRDSIHFRLRERHTQRYFVCLSCGGKFESTSLLEVYEHYGEREHTQHHADCLYCRGKVHRYCELISNQVHYYHDCLRWKRRDDK